jgi:hypothetical protein
MRGLRDAAALKGGLELFYVWDESTTSLDRTGPRPLIHGFPAANLPLGREGETHQQG